MLTEDLRRCTCFTHAAQCLLLCSRGSAPQVMVSQDRQDFIPQCNLLSIDYCSIHLWPNNWNTYDPTFPTTWITAHEQATRTLNKPLVLEEVRCSLEAIRPFS